MYIIIILNGNTWRCVNKIASLCGPHLWFRFDLLTACHSSTCQLRRSFGTVLDGLLDSSAEYWRKIYLHLVNHSVIIVHDTVYFVRNGGADSPRCPTCRFAARDVPCDGGCRIASPAWATSTGLGRPEDRRSRLGHIGKTRGRQPVVPIKREVVMKYLRYKFCGILRSVYVFFFQNKTINPLKK